MFTTLRFLKLTFIAKINQRIKLVYLPVKYTSHHHTVAHHLGHRKGYIFHDGKAQGNHYRRHPPLIFIFASSTNFILPTRLIFLITAQTKNPHQAGLFSCFAPTRLTILYFSDDA